MLGAPLAVRVEMTKDERICIKVSKEFKDFIDVAIEFRNDNFGLNETKTSFIERAVRNEIFLTDTLEDRLIQSGLNGAMNGFGKMAEKAAIRVYEADNKIAAINKEKRNYKKTLRAQAITSGWNKRQLDNAMRSADRKFKKMMEIATRIVDEKANKEKIEKYREFLEKPEFKRFKPPNSRQ